MDGRMGAIEQMAASDPRIMEQCMFSDIGQVGEERTHEYVMRQQQARNRVLSGTHEV